LDTQDGYSPFSVQHHHLMCLFFVAVSVSATEFAFLSHACSDVNVRPYWAEISPGPPAQLISF
jgi:hypothetical protein